MGLMPRSQNSDSAQVCAPLGHSLTVCVIDCFQLLNVVYFICVQGWIDNWNGPSGLYIAVSIILYRVTHN